VFFWLGSLPSGCCLDFKSVAIGVYRFSNPVASCDTSID